MHLGVGDSELTLMKKKIYAQYWSVLRTVRRINVEENNDDDDDDDDSDSILEPHYSAATMKLWSWNCP